MGELLDEEDEDRVEIVTERRRGISSSETTTSSRKVANLRRCRSSHAFIVALCCVPFPYRQRLCLTPLFLKNVPYASSWLQPFWIFSRSYTRTFWEMN